MITELITLLLTIELGLTQIVTDIMPENDICTKGECVPYYQCPNNKRVTNGLEIIDIRSDNPAESPRKCLSTEICCKRNDSMTIESGFHGCGHSFSINSNLRIVSGQLADYAEFPWMAAILQVDPVSCPQKFIYFCGGSLIHPKVILTAAHNVAGKLAGSLKVRLGDWNIETEDEKYPHEDRSVVDIVTHSDYETGSVTDDIALLFLSDNVKLGGHIQTVCLPPQNTNFDGSQCLSSGWGNTKFGQIGNKQVILKKVPLAVVPSDKCKTQLSLQLGDTFDFHHSFLCAGGEPGVDTCTGDGGSPLVCPISDTYRRYYQSGIVSWGMGCGENEIPGIYVNVAEFRNWIDQIFAERNLDTVFYTFSRL